MILVDTTVWVDHFNAHPSPSVQRLQRAFAEDEIAIGEGEGLILTHQFAPILPNAMTLFGRVTFDL